jgi:hypothetical protein
MHVIDAAGAEVGKVDFVRMGDTDAVTTQGNDGGPTELVGAIAEAVLPDEREPDVPEPLRSRLLRGGYIKIDGPGMRDTDRYVSSDHVRAVSGDRVQLDVRKEELAIED